ncbi:MAG TPA: hypothetical protein VIJ34_05120, partial [Acidimicrobiales bacterium]
NDRTTTSRPLERLSRFVFAHKVVARQGGADASTGGPSAHLLLTHLETVGELYAGEPHVQIERGMGNQGRSSAPAPLTTNDK